MAGCIWRLFQNHGLKKLSEVWEQKKTPLQNNNENNLRAFKGRHEIVKGHSVNLQHECTLFISLQKKKAKFHHLICQQKHKQQQKGRKPEKKLISSYGNDFFRENMGEESYSMANARSSSEPSPYSWRVGSQPALARAFPSIAVWQHLAGCFQQSTHVKTHSRALSCLRLSFVTYTNIFPNQLLVHN